MWNEDCGRSSSMPMDRLHAQASDVAFLVPGYYETHIRYRTLEDVPKKSEFEQGLWAIAIDKARSTTCIAGFPLPLFAGGLWTMTGRLHNVTQR